MTLQEQIAAAEAKLEAAEQRAEIAKAEAGILGAPTDSAVAERQRKAELEVREITAHLKELLERQERENRA